MTDPKRGKGVLTNTNITTYMTGSSLIALGLTWWQAIIAIIVGAILSMVGFIPRLSARRLMPF